MSDFEKARRQMVDCQIRPNDITDFDVISAFSAVPREEFLPSDKKMIAYIDRDLNIEASSHPERERYLIQVTPFAKMVQAASIAADEFVLCVGSGCGYGAAVIARLADSVIGLEESESLVARASDVINNLAIENLAIVRGELAKGYLLEAPFDVIIIEGAVESVPDTLFKQFKDHGRLVCVVGHGLSGVIHLYRKTGDDISLRRLGNASLPVLPGFAHEKGFVF
mgnify:CR=1 FL=1